MTINVTDDDKHARRHFSRAPELAKTEKWFWDRDFFERIVAPMCELRPGCRVLDVGAGIGALGRMLYPHIQPGGEILGLELQQENADVGNAHNKEHGFDNIRLLQGDARALTSALGGQAFDLVMEVGMLCLLANTAERRDVLSQMVELTRPGGHVASLEIDMSALLTAVESDTFARLREYVDAFIAGMRATEHEDLKLAAAMPGFFFDQGLKDIKLVPYIPPEPFPPFSDETIGLAEDFGSAWFDPSSAGHKWIRWYLVRGGLADSRVDNLCENLGVWWRQRMAAMRRGEFPPMMTQVFLLVIGRRAE